ncbi:MAG: glycosyltransferase [Akkermansiaceae bacterium]|nr:glycosyltransferase [Akkermansiaceae bacterium]
MSGPDPAKPVAACYCPTYLAAEMLHVHRQITGLREFEPVVLTRKRLHEGRFPFPPERLELLPRPNAVRRELRRFWRRRVAKSRAQTLSGAETRALLVRLERRKAAVLHIYFGNSAVSLLPLLRIAGRPCPIVVSFHGADAGVGLDDGEYRALMAEVFDRADAILARSRALANDLQSLGCPREKITIQRAGIPLENWPPVDRDPPPGDAWRFVQTGRLIEKKGHETTLRAFARFRERFHAANLVILGDGPLEPDLRGLVNDLDIRAAVTFGGFVEETRMRLEYDWAHAFLHPSRTGADGNREGVPNAMLEAMATGLPVLATRHGGIPEAVEDSVSGLLVEEDDWEALAERMLDLTADPDAWRAMGNAARAAVEAKFERDGQVRVLEGVYRRAVEGFRAS